MQNISEYLTQVNNHSTTINEAKAIDYIKSFCEKNGVFDTIKKIAISAKDTVTKTVVVYGYILYKLVTSSSMPLREKMLAFGAIVYLITPFDVIGDMLPGGYTDDIVIIEETIRLLSKYITPELKSEAEEFYSKMQNKNK